LAEFGNRNINGTLLPVKRKKPGSKMSHVRTYTTIDVKTLIRNSQIRNSPWTEEMGHAATGHAAEHHGSVATDAHISRNAKSAFLHTADSSFGKKMLVEDQNWHISQVLNSDLGQAALGQLDNFDLARVGISALASDIGLTIRIGKGAYSMNHQANPGGLKPMQQASALRFVVILDTKKDLGELHFVTAYPKKTLQDREFGVDAGFKIEYLDLFDGTASDSYMWKKGQLEKFDSEGIINF